MYNRKKTRAVKAGSLVIGGDSPISVQSMTKTDTRDVAATVAQINALAAAGCELVRVAVPDMRAAEALFEIVKNVSVPIAADIHFDYRLALRAIEAGIHKLRLNPGNIGGRGNVKLVATAAKQKGIPIRVGVNSGSLEKDILEKHGRVTAEALCESALRHVTMLEEEDFYDIVITVKGSDAPTCIEAYSLLSEKTDYPLHVGVTEAGTLFPGAVKSACALGAILSRGIGDTVRVSLADDPIHEVDCAKRILQSLGLRKFSHEFIVCPTCGRTEISLIEIAKKIEDECKNIETPLKIAVMGCAVNGPGEAREADIGLAGGKGFGMIFKKGEILRRVGEEQLISELMKEIRAMAVK